MFGSADDRVLVLNADYQAISLCSVERAFLLLYLKKAEAVEACADKVIRSVNRSFSLPSIIRLRRYVQVPYRKVSLTRANVFRRDGYKCGYCGSRQHLTLDHVLPRCRGGRDSWDNLVTACQSCNTKKGNRLPEEAGMELARKPFRPSYVMYLTNFSPRVDDGWRPYLML